MKKKLLALFRSAPSAFWRHDVDVDLDAAVQMARFAQVAGIRSTFYLNPRSYFYNPFARPDAIAAIIEAGHEIGLHCDYRGDEPIAVVVERDLALLGHIAPPTEKVSFHMPLVEVLWQDFAAFENAYAARWKDHYLADSRGRELERKPTNDDQINLHPEWWW